MAICIQGLDPSEYKSHELHSLTRDWPQTNCYADLWIELLSSLEFEPRAAFGFAVTQNFECDQFTFFKPCSHELFLLYGLQVRELAIYDSVEDRVLKQIEAGRLVSIEVDAFYLPDTAHLSYKSRHTKTTIAINELDTRRKKIGYLHNAGYYVADGEDYDGLLQKHPVQIGQSGLLFPYAEIVEITTSRQTENIVSCAAHLLRQNLAKRPSGNPIKAFGLAFEEQSAELASRSMGYYNDYAFNTVRQIGASFELLSTHLDWLESNGVSSLREPASSAKRVSSVAKAVLFKMARMASRRIRMDLDSQIASLAAAYEETLSALMESHGSRLSAAE